MEFDLRKLILPTVIFIALFAALQAVSPFVAALDITVLPEWSRVFVEALQHFFKMTPWAVIMSYGWALFGWLRSNIGENADFDSERLTKTLMWFEGLVMLFGIGFGPETAAGIAAMFMAAKSVINQAKLPPLKRA